MIEANSGNRSQRQGGPREGAAGRKPETNRRPYEQKRTVRPDMGDKRARSVEIQQLCKPCQVESEGTAGKFGVLPRETSSEASASGEESAEVVVGGWKFLGKDLQEMEQIRAAEGLKSKGDDLNPNSLSSAQEGTRAGGPGKQKWLSGMLAAPRCNRSSSRSGFRVWRGAEGGKKGTSARSDREDRQR